MPTPTELHRLASKTRGSMGADEAPASCHSDVSDDASARAMQAEKLDPRTLETLTGRGLAREVEREVEQP